MDEYRVTVAERRPREIVLHLSRRNRDASLPLGKSFARMLITDESCPAHPAWLLIWERETAKDENFWLQNHVVSMTLDEVFAPRIETETEDGDAGSARVRIALDRDGLLDHLEPGLVWGTTAYDEGGDCLHFEFPFSGEDG